MDPVQGAQSPSSDRVELTGCDLVMKGGIASGIVYPRAISELSKRYRFHSIGGSSAGAIAAAAAAAAEFRRQSSGDDGGFRLLKELPGRLAKGGTLANLFKPEGSTRFARDVLAPVLEKGVGFRSLLACATELLAAGAKWASPVGLSMLLGIGLVFSSAGWVWQSGLLVALITILGTVVMLLAAFGRFLQRANSEIGHNYMGICAGICRPDSLTRWLDAQVNEIAGLTAHSVLTLGELRRHGIDLQVMTTALSHGRPYRLPFQRGERFFFREKQMRELFPTHVVDHMVTAAIAADGKVPAVPGDLLSFPDKDALPVIVALRMSLSFPVLISSVPLWAVDRQDSAVESDAAVRAEPCWFSDGGICLNFPIHLFDAPIPTRPTFCINLRYPGEHPGRERVSMADGNAEGWEEVWYHPRSGDAPQSKRDDPDEERPQLTWLFAAIFRSLHRWVDQSRARMPGFRDRIVHVNLDDGEGGMHLYMPEEKINAIASAGTQAADALITRFTQPQAVLSQRTGWDNHKWLRYRATLAQLEVWLSVFRRGMGSATGAFVRQEAGRPLGEQVSYRWVNNDQADLAQQGVEDVLELADRWWRNAEEGTLHDPMDGERPRFMQKGAPKPRAEMTARPRI